MHTHDNEKKSSMDQMIFKLGLPMETVSVYLLCCGLADAEQSITSKNLLEVWNGSEEELSNGLNSLEKRNILLRIISDQKENSVFKVLDVRKWKSPGKTSD